MSRTYDRPISIQRINETTETWEDAYKVHASINKTKTDNQYLDAGAIRSKKNLTFEIRYFSDLEDISFNFLFSLAVMLSIINYSLRSINF